MVVVDARRGAEVGVAGVGRRRLMGCCSGCTAAQESRQLSCTAAQESRQLRREKFGAEAQKEKS